MALTQQQIQMMRNTGVPEKDIQIAIAAQKPAATTSTVKPATVATVPKTTTSTRTTSGLALPSGVTDVFSLQKDLNSKGANLVVDGVYGPKTDSAYKQYASIGSAPTVATPAVTVPTIPSTPTSPIPNQSAATKATVPSGVNAFDLLGFKPKEYKSDLYDRALAMVEDAQDDVFSYDPSQDAAYQQYVDKATESGARAYSSAQGSRNRNGLISSSVADTIAQNAQNRYTNSAKEAVNDFRDKALNEFNVQRNDKLTQAKSLLGMDEVNYNRFQEQEKAAASARDKYADETGYYAVDISAIPKDSWIWSVDDDYEGGYRAYIDNLKKTDPNSDLIPILEAVRNNKMENDPALLAKYGDTRVYTPGVKTAETRQAEAEKAEAARIAAMEASTGGTSTRSTSGGTTRSTSSSVESSPDDLNELLQGMLDSGDPVAWYGKYVTSLSPEQQKYLKPYALDKYSDPVKMMDAAPNGTRYLFRYYVDGETAYDMNNPTGFATKNKYANDPQAALNDIQSSTSARKALGSLYEYTVSMLKSKVASAKTQEPSETGYSNVQTAVAAIKSSADPYAMFAGWSRQVKDQAGYAQLLAALKSATGAKFSQERLQAALQGPTSR